MTYTRVSTRLYGQPKLQSPKELKGMDSFSVDFIHGKCKCKVYIENDNIWIKHHDFFSEEFFPDQEDIGKPLSFILKKYFKINKSDKFIYPDCWGSVILRNEAWLKFEDVLLFYKNQHSFNECYNLFATSEEMLRLFCSKENIDNTSVELHYGRFFESIMNAYYKVLESKRTAN
jgi:hypothetical protein